jgi:hypothetical protein
VRGGANELALPNKKDWGYNEEMFEIKRRVDSKLPDKETLQTLYWSEMLTMREIADRYDTHPATVLYHLRKQNIQIRDRSESSIIATSKGRRSHGKRKSPEAEYTIDGKIICDACKVPKDKKEFRDRPDTKRGVSRRCNSCATARGQLWKRRKEMYQRGVALCARCIRWLPLAEFSADKTNYKYGIAATCKRCSSTNAEYHDYLVERETLLSFGMKYCPACELVFSVDKFGPHSASTDKLQSVCKKCRWKMNNALYRQKNPEIKRGFSSDELKLRRKQTVKRFYQNHKEIILVKHKLRIARKRSGDGGYTIDQWTMLVSFYSPNGECVCCKKNELRLGPDHVKALARGGSGLIFNIQPMCLPCNNKKHVREIEYRFDGGVYARSLMGI